VTLECPHCGKGLTTIEIDRTFVHSYLVYSKEINNYIPAIEIMEYGLFRCPHCRAILDESEIDIDYGRYLLRPWGDKKRVIVSREELPFDVEAIEDVEKLPKSVKIESEQENED